MNFVILKYCGILSTRVDRFVVKSNRPYRANFRCPICGDSDKSKKKARGWILEQKDIGYARYYCHNCNSNLSFHIFLRTIDYSLYEEFSSEFSLDKLKNEPKKSDVEVFADKMKTPEFVKNSPLSKLKKMSALDHDHPAKKYIEDRKIPTQFHHKLFYCPKFKKFTNTVIPDKFNNLNIDEPRLIIPFIGKNKEFYGYTGRSFSNKEKKLRYITIMLDSNYPKVFGLDTCDQTKPHYIFEGAIDSMFVSNSIAMCGGHLSWDGWNSQSIFVYDNEPRSTDTIHRIETILDHGAKVVIWPEKIVEKDINEIILRNPETDIERLLEDNIWEGIGARLKLSEWRKV